MEQSNNRRNVRRLLLSNSVTACTKTWTLDSGQWTMDERRWTVDDGRWTMDDVPSRNMATQCGHARFAIKGFSTTTMFLSRNI